MPTLNSYSLSRSVEKKKGLYERMHNYSLLLWIFAVLSLIGLFWSLWFLSAVLFFSVGASIVSVLGSKVLYRITYRYQDDALYVIKTSLSGVDTVLERVDTADILCTFVSELPQNKIYFSTFESFGEEKPLRVQTADNDFTILSDLYLYSLLQLKKQEKT